MSEREQLIEKARVAFTEAWEAERKKIGRGIAEPGTKSRAGIVAALAVFEDAHTPTDQESRNARRERGECGNAECGQGRAHSGPCAPTDDEREALAQWLHMRFAWPHSPNERTPWLDLPERLKDGWRDLAGDAPAGFRRTVQGEPISEATHRGTFGHVWPCPLFYVGNWKRIENGHEPVRECTSPAVCAPATVQGEPNHEGHEFCDPRLGCVQGELTAGQAGPCARGDHETCQVVAGMGIGSCGCACHRPQGEPRLRDHVRALTGETDAGLSELGGFQGEPTDAQVLAALNAREPSVRERSGIARHFNPAPDLSYYSEGNVADMRAALRAAFNETGEKHG